MNTGRPTEVFCRMADALFFYIDRNVEIPHFRMTQHIEPAKYGWFTLRLGMDANNVSEYASPLFKVVSEFSYQSQIVQDNLQSFYDAAGIPYRIVTLNGAHTPIIDRRGFLHMVVFEARAAPEEAHQVLVPPDGAGFHHR
jgi:hypothetical protein